MKIGGGSAGLCWAAVAVIASAGCSDAPQRLAIPGESAPGPAGAPEHAPAPAVSQPHPTAPRAAAAQFEAHAALNGVEGALPEAPALSPSPEIDETPEPSPADPPPVEVPTPTPTGPGVQFLSDAQGPVISFRSAHSTLRFRPGDLVARDAGDAALWRRAPNADSAPEEVGGSTIYRDAYGPGADLVYQFDEGGALRALLRLNQPMALPSATRSVDLQEQLFYDRALQPEDSEAAGARWEPDALYLVDEGGVVAFTLPPPVAWDAAREDLPWMTHRISQHAPGQALLHTRLPADWLRSASRRYPVWIDPSLYDGRPEPALAATQIAQVAPGACTVVAAVTYSNFTLDLLDLTVDWGDGAGLHRVSNRPLYELHRYDAEAVRRVAIQVCDFASVPRCSRRERHVPVCTMNCDPLDDLCNDWTLDPRSGACALSSGDGGPCVLGCADASECGPGQRCSGGQCLSDCAAADARDCAAGFACALDGFCSDIDECAAPDTCAADERCFNTPGSVICESAGCELTGDDCPGQVLDTDRCACVCPIGQVDDGAGACTCPAGHFGPTCAGICRCSGQGCDEGPDGSGACECDEGRFGVDCAQSCDCVNGDCAGGAQGTGLCGCAAGFFGVRCDKACDAATTCSGHGVCNSEGDCRCADGFEGADCASCKVGFEGPDCLPAGCLGGALDCGPRGSCQSNGACRCAPGFAGAACDRCEAGLFGPDCDRRCDDAQCGRGACNRDGGCACEPGFAGAACERCAPGFYGPDCRRRCDPLESCNGQGRCDENGRCECNTGFAGASCNRCDVGYFGDACELFCPTGSIGRECIQQCDADTTCKGHGRCDLRGDCICNEGFAGDNCERCDDGYEGSDCKFVCRLPSSCNGRGVCEDATTCRCEQGFAGDRCERCAAGYFGERCDRRCDCANGTCDDGLAGTGRCDCFPGFHGDSCSFVCGDGVREGDEECDDGGTALGDGCDAECRIEVACDPSVSVCDRRPPRGCAEADAVFCDGFDVAEEAARVTAYFQGEDPDCALAPSLCGPFNAQEALACAGYQIDSCLPCRQWTLDECAALGPFLLPPAHTRSDEELLCYVAGATECDLVLEAGCPPLPTLGQCASEGFRENPGGVVYPEACNARVQAQCTQVFRDACPLGDTLEFCGALQSGDILFLPPGCEDFTQGQCTATVNRLCPTVDAELCGQIEDEGFGALPTACRIRALICNGFWEPELCPEDLFYAINGTNCAENPERFDHNFQTPQCQEWALGTACRDAIAAQAEAHFEDGTAAGPGCDTSTVRTQVDDLDYQVESSVSDASRFDCGPDEIAAEHPHDQDFDPTDLEEFVITLAPAVARTLSAPARITDCEDYVFQKYWNYSIYDIVQSFFLDDASRTPDGNSRRLFQFLYSDLALARDSALGYRALHESPRFETRDGYALDTVVSLGGDYAEPKNELLHINVGVHGDFLAAFTDLNLQYQLLYDSFPTAEEAEAFETERQALVDRLNSLEEYWFRSDSYGSQDGWHHHQNMSQGMRDQGITDEELTFWHARRRRFTQILEDFRRSSEASAAIFLATLPKPGPTGPDGLPVIIPGRSLTAEEEARREAHQENMEVLFFEAEALILAADQAGTDCFEDRRGSSPVLPAVCDWSPRDIQDDIQRYFEAAKAADRTRCEELAPADFGDLSVGYAYFERDPLGDVQRRVESEDPTGDHMDFETYLDRTEAGGVLAFEFYADLVDNLPEDELPRESDAEADQQDHGDSDYFCANFDYGTSWDVNVPPNDICQSDARAEAHANATVCLPFVTFDVISGRALVDTGLEEDEPTIFGELELLGAPLFRSGISESGPSVPQLDYDFNLVVTDAGGEKSETVDVTVPVFSIAGFNINLTAGFTGRVGMDFSAGARVGANLGGTSADPTCEAGLDVVAFATIRPYTALDAFVRLGIDLFLVEIGIGGDLNLLTIEVPSSFSLGFTAEADDSLINPFETHFAVTVDSELVLSTLSGKLYIYADTFWETYKWTFFSWKGPEWRYTLLDSSFRYDLDLFTDYCANVGCD